MPTRNHRPLHRREEVENMEIGKEEKETIVVEPILEPVRKPAPQEPVPVPQEPVKTPA
jgi:hypothetical protein